MARTVLAARRARARADREARHSRHRARRLRPWRLERLAAARGPGDARAHVQRLDRDAALPDADRRWRARCAAIGRAQEAAQFDESRRSRAAGFPAPAASSTACSPATRCSRTAARALSAASERHDDRRALQLAGDDPRDPRRPAHAGAGAQASATHRRAPARTGRRAAVRSADAVSRRPAALLPARRERDVLRPRDRAHVHARAPALRAGAGARRRGGSVLPCAVPGQPDRHPRDRAARDAAPGELLLLELRRGVRRSLRGQRGIRARRRRTRRARRRLARVFERRRHRAGADRAALPRA